MTDDNRVEGVPIYIPPQVLPGGAEIRVSEDDRYTARQPDRINAADSTGAGLQTEWDITSLDNAITWLEEHADYLGDRLVPAMASDIGSWLNAPVSSSPENAKSPFGSYPAAPGLAARHFAHFQGAEQSIRTIAEELLQASRALVKVKEQYETAERANRMSAEAFEQVFTSQVTTGEYGSGSTSYPTTGATAAEYPSTPPASTSYQGA